MSRFLAVVILALGVGWVPARSAVAASLTDQPPIASEPTVAPAGGGKAAWIAAVCAQPQRQIRRFSSVPHRVQHRTKSHGFFYVRTRQDRRWSIARALQPTPFCCPRSKAVASLLRSIVMLAAGVATTAAI